MGGTSARSRSICSTTSRARAGSARASRPVRHAARRRRAGGRGSRRRRSLWRTGATPRWARSATAQPSMSRTTGRRRSARLDAVPVSSSACSRPSLSGASHRSDSRVLSGSGNVSARGPVPRTGPPGRPVGVVMGRLCNSHTVPSSSTAHSMSCGAPNAALARAASRASARSVARPRGSAAPPRCSRTRPRGDRTAVHPSSRPLTRRSGPPSTAARRNRSVRPVTGSAAKSTPPKRGASCGWTSTAMRAPTTSARRCDPRTRSTASTKLGQVRTSSTDSNTPAIDDEPPSSFVDDDRTTSVRSPEAPSVSHAARAGLCSERDGCDQPRWSHSVVSTTPGRTGRPARRARARLAALAPTSDPSTAPSSERSTRSERRRTRGNVSMNARVSGGACTAVAARLQVVACGTKAR